MANSEKHGAAILGGGSIGKVHAYAYATLPFYSNPVPLNVRVKYVVCAHAESAAAAAALLGLCTVFLLDVEKMKKTC